MNVNTPVNKPDDSVAAVGKTYTNSTGLLGLPPELQIQSFSHAHFSDVVRCSAVCKHFHALIKDSVLLQYLIELGAAGYVNGGKTITFTNRGCAATGQSSTLLTIAQRLERLRKLEHAWQNMAFDFLWRHDQLMSSATIYECYGGVFARGSNTVPGTPGASSLQIIRLPSPFSDNEAPTARSWSHEHLGIPQARDFGMDPGADLLVIIEKGGYYETDGATYHIHLKTLSSNRDHPLAARPDLDYRPRGAHGNVGYSFTINILSDKLGILFSYPPVLGPGHNATELVIWNWRKGEIISTLFSEEFVSPSFAFLSLNTFIVPHIATSGANGREQVCASLLVYSFAALEHPRSDNEKGQDAGTGSNQASKGASGPAPSPTLLAAFRLPTFCRTVQLCLLSIRSDPQPCPQYYPTEVRQDNDSLQPPQKRDPEAAQPPKDWTMQMSGKPFYPDPLKRVFVISVDLFVGRPLALVMDRIQYTLFVHSNAFIEFCGRDLIERGVGRGCGMEDIGIRPHPKSEPSPEGRLSLRARLLRAARRSSRSPNVQPGSDWWQRTNSPMTVDSVQSYAPYEWNEWSKYARWTALIPRSNFVCYTYGQRFIGYNSDIQEPELFLWDFNQILIRRLQLSREDTDPPAGADILELGDFQDAPADDQGCCSTESEIFARDVFEGGSVKSSLPYRRIGVPLESLASCAGVMLDEERIIVLDKPRNRRTALALIVMGMKDRDA